jgi:hypothetical protein
LASSVGNAQVTAVQTGFALLQLPVPSLQVYVLDDPE